MHALEAIRKLKEIRTRKERDLGHDPTEEHSDADKVLCDLLILLGYGEVVEEYKKIEKWYA